MIEGPPPVPTGSVALPLFIGSEIYRGSSYGPRHPLRVPRVSTVMDLARALGWLPPDRFRTSPRPSRRRCPCGTTPTTSPSCRPPRP